MEKTINLDCSQHKDIYSCPDVLVRYIPKFDEYGLIIHDGSSSAIQIKFCPWCGENLPDSKRDIWFNSLESLGITDPFEQDIPLEFKSEAWYQDT